MLPNRLEVQLRGASARLACGADVGSAAGRLVTSEYAVNGVSCLRCPDVAKVQSIQIQGNPSPLFLQMSEDTDNIAVEENVDKHLQKDLNMEENQNIIETLRGKVREKLKNAKTEVSLDEGLSFFILSGEEDSTLGQSAEQRSVNDSYHKHFSLGDNLQNFAEGRDEDFMEEVIFLDLLEVKAADYEDDQEQVKKQQANIFVPSNSPGKVFTRKYSSH
ncbi:protein CC2D2B homolog [Balaenoptera acutorostrata]|uniref:Protein CC2D2B homolog n=1 Tax=Balaenoptera acutorostrata TaxID=9767 RepID=A0ABM3S9Q1_BALAC|nr:protein CC2D2B homolog [Balaenoptera acutorostrata]